MVKGGIRHHVDGGNVRVREGLVQICEHEGRAAEEPLDLAFAQVGVLGIQVAHRHQVDVADAALFQFLVGQDMTVTHTAAADQAEWNLFQCSFSSLSIWLIAQ